MYYSQEALKFAQDVVSGKISSLEAITALKDNEGLLNAVKRIRGLNQRIRTLLLIAIESKERMISAAGFIAVITKDLTQMVTEMSTTWDRIMETPNLGNVTFQETYTKPLPYNNTNFNATVTFENYAEDKASIGYVDFFVHKGNKLTVDEGKIASTLDNLYNIAVKGKVIDDPNAIAIYNMILRG